MLCNNTMCKLIVKTGGCDPEIGPEYLLVDYLRDKIGLTGQYKMYYKMSETFVAPERQAFSID